MRRTLTIIAAVAALALAAPSGAVVKALDEVPAATLLMPYFQVDLEGAYPYSVKTMLRVGNASANPVLAHATVWTDWAVPTLSFDLYLPGYDSLDIDMRLVLAGILPQTGPGLVRGAYSGANTSFPGCPALLNATRMSEEAVTSLRAAHTGQRAALLGNLFASTNYGDGIARGYVTIDVVNACSSAFPGDPGYFEGASRIASDANVLVGSTWVIENMDNFAYAEPAVHLEADPLLTGTYTFYARVVQATATRTGVPQTFGNDHRERLSTAWDVRYLNGGPFSGGTELVVWRDAGRGVPTNFSPPPPLPLQEGQLVPFDEQEQPVSLCRASFGGFRPPDCGRHFRWATQLVETYWQIDIPFQFGAMYINFQSFAFNPYPLPGDNETFRQAYVRVIMRSEGRFATSFAAWPMELQNGNLPPLLPID